ncbi:TPA: IS30 family transposase [Legionella pneumophila subsp. pneumophila]|nr:IS30 family transposase [Legionella pneumophila subsp. pneumophila]HAT9288173.1 IS30 family transposase [Legionella pneumophila subsp. pneumophila]HAT9463963.1 IS30 family transposase [Legionella pneumophila subsp. pneumophila]HAT9483547.1 IS30 family transposase [Legionella pneumophila subsp. pneumophila]
MGQYTQLSVRDRRRLFVYLEMGLSVIEIAHKISRHRSTIYRELNRNNESGLYLPIVAQQKTLERSKNSRPNKLKNNGVLRDYVTRSLIDKGWSPEQISGRMKHQNLSFYVCPETIYRYVYQSNDKALYHSLTFKKPKRQKLFRRKHRACRYGNPYLITKRPEEIDTRARFGHWEGDTIEFKGNKSEVVTTLVERKTRMVFLIKNKSKHSRGVMEKINTKFEGLPKKMMKTITFDQGSEFADHQYLEEHMRCEVYYCEAHSPWQKGSNENMNGRLRKYLPKNAKINLITQEELDVIAAKMNRCPRKCIGYKTPNELFIQQYKNDCRTWS